jgi:hypothetical protein
VKSVGDPVGRKIVGSGEKKVAGAAKEKTASVMSDKPSGEFGREFGGKKNADFFFPRLVKRAHTQFFFAIFSRIRKNSEKPFT